MSLISSLLALGSCGSSGADEATRAGGSSKAYYQLLRALYKGTVPVVAPGRLAQELSQPPAPLLLDVRTPAEFTVSHLQGAQFVPFDSIATATFEGLDRSQPVVVYCSVGVRSERLAERLQALGFQHVRNLYGGLFEWVNEGRPLYNAQGPTNNIHPYSAVWSPWLKRGNKVYE